MSKPSPTGRLTETQPEFQEIKPSAFHMLKARIGGSLNLDFSAIESRVLPSPRGHDKSWLRWKLLQLEMERAEYLAEQRQMARFGYNAIRFAVDSLIRSYKR